MSIEGGIVVNAFNSNDYKFVIKVENRQSVGHPMSYSNFLLVFPGCQVQETPTNDVIGPYGYEIFVHTPEPTPGVFEHRAIVTGYVCNDGTWTQQWECLPFTTEEIQVRTNKEWDFFRTKRNAFLRLTDWTQVTDAPVTEQQRTDWTVYRQQLRDLPSITTDPFNILWPTPPSPVEFPKPLPYSVLNQ